MALVNPNIAMSFRQPEFTPRNALAEYAQIQQIQGGQRQAEMADMQMEALRRDRDALSQIQAAIVAKGGPPDLAAAADAMIKSGKPEYFTQGMAIRQKLADQTAFANYQKEFGPAAPAAAPMAAPAALEPGSFAADVMQRRAAMSNDTMGQTNALAPAAAAPAAPVNAMVGKPDVASLEARYRRVANLETPGAKAEAALLLKQIEAASKESRMYTVPGVGLVDPTGRVITSSVATPTDLQRNYEFAKTPEGGNFRGSLADFKVLSTPKTTTNVNVSTEKKYGERFGGLIADQDASKLAAAEAAPQAAATADRITDLIDSGKVITGTGANFRLQVAKALNLAGNTDAERIRNTEILGASLAETTLGAIKSSNLGAGQGFTNADRDFLEKAKAGQITFDAQSLKELARLARLAAEKSADSWNTRVKQIPASALEGTGISTNPIVVPKRSIMKNSGRKGDTSVSAPAGVDSNIWQYMTPEERNLWPK
jgi:hypothetical protein